MVIYYLQCCEPPLLPKLVPLPHSDSLSVSSSLSSTFSYEWTFRSEPPNFLSMNHCSLVQLLCGFFHFYGITVDFSSQCISVAAGKLLPKSKTQFPAKSSSTAALPWEAMTSHCDQSTPVSFYYGQSPSLCIQDPYDPHDNVARNITSKVINAMQYEFHRGFYILAKACDPLPVPSLSLLSSSSSVPSTSSSSAESSFRLAPSILDGLAQVSSDEQIFARSVHLLGSSKKKMLECRLYAFADEESVKLKWSSLIGSVETPSSSSSSASSSSSSSFFSSSFCCPLSPTSAPRFASTSCWLQVSLSQLTILDASSSIIQLEDKKRTCESSTRGSFLGTSLSDHFSCLAYLDFGAFLATAVSGSSTISISPSSSSFFILRLCQKTVDSFFHDVADAKNQTQV